MLEYDDEISNPVSGRTYFCKGGTVMPLTRTYRLKMPRRFLISRQESYILRCYSQGHVDRAYRLGVAWERYAVRRGDQVWAHRLHSFSAAVGKVRGQSGRPAIMSLEQSAQQAASQEYWSQAVAYTTYILGRRPVNDGVRARALANQATGLHTLGRLDEALSAYDALMGDRGAWNQLGASYQVGFAVSREIVQWYRQEPINTQVIGDATPDMGQAPATWMAYWWLLGHIAWRQSPNRLAGIRASSHRTFGMDWRLDYDRALWGLDLLAAGDGDDTEVLERRVRHALTDPATLEFLGRSAWIDLYLDWLAFLSIRRPWEAVEAGARFSGWCGEFGCDGWADYWRRNVAVLM